MPRISRAFLFLSLLTALLLTPHSPATARGCGSIDTLAAPDGDEPVERWRYLDPEAGHYQITGEDRGTLYAGISTPGCAYGFSTFVALDDETGEAEWEITGGNLDGDVSGFVEQFEDRILFPVFDGEVSGLTAVDAATGEAAWSLEGENTFLDPVGVVDNLLIVLESDLERSIVTAVEVESGEPIWSVALDGYTSNFFLSDEALIAPLRTGEADSFRWETIALDPEDGDELWSLPKGDVEISVRAEDNGLAYAIAGDPFLAAEAAIALDPATGDEVWRTEFDPEDLWLFSGIVDEGLLLRGGLLGEVSLLVLAPETGDELWRAEELENRAGLPNTVVQHTDDLAVVEWTDDAEGVVTLTGIDLESGEEVWTSDPIAYGIGYRLTVSEETGQAYIAANFGASSGLHALDLEDGSLVWDAAYDDLSEPEILSITDETRLPLRLDSGPDIPDRPGDRLTAGTTAAPSPARNRL